LRWRGDCSFLGGYEKKWGAEKNRADYNVKWLRIGGQAVDDLFLFIMDGISAMRVSSGNAALMGRCLHPPEFIA
jgi:hypothetical protein